MLVKFALPLTIFFCVNGVYAKPEARIVGGYEVDISKAKYQASIQVKNKHNCGGSVISNRVVLTAAHCTLNYEGDNKQYVKVILGSTNWDKPNPNHIYGISDASHHPKYNPSNSKNDIGLVILDKDIDFSDGSVTKVDIFLGSVKNGESVFLTGWGVLSIYDPKAPSHLQGIELTVVSKVICALNWFTHFHTTQVCTKVWKGHGTCKGDSGSPLVNKNGQQIGLVSFGKPCAVNKPDVFTRVAPFMDYVNKHVKIYG